MTTLEVKCTTCDGAGVVRSRDWSDWWKRHRKDWKEALVAGDIPEEPEQVECPNCEGAGTVATEAGTTLMFFLSRHWESFRGKITE